MPFIITNILGGLDRFPPSSTGGQQFNGFAQAASLRSAAGSEVAKQGKSTSVPPPPPPEPTSSSVIGGLKKAPTSLDKIFLKWSGQFKRGQEIPASVEGEVIHRARSYARVRINIGFLLLAALLSGGMVYSGKQAAKRGESIEKENLAWHKQVNDDHRRSGSN